MVAGRRRSALAAAMVARRSPAAADDKFLVSHMSTHIGSHLGMQLVAYTALVDITVISKPPLSMHFMVVHDWCTMLLVCKPCPNVHTVHYIDTEGHGMLTYGSPLAFNTRRTVINE